MRGGGKCAWRVLCSPERESGRRKEAGGGRYISLFSASLCLPPIAAGVVSHTFARCSTIDGSLIFARRKPCHFSRSLLVRDKLKRERIQLSYSLNLAINILYSIRLVYIFARKYSNFYMEVIFL